jgi:glutaminyl-tRNA synthetase
MAAHEPTTPLDFIRERVEADLESGKFGGRVHTRFPPEPNGYLHIGHAKSICLNFGVAQQYGGQCNLRMDDTNPTTEDVEYVQAIQRDVRWLGFDWEDRMFYASDYFEQIYGYAERLVELGKAYVDSQTAEQISEQRGTLTTPGKDSPHRSRSTAENLDLLRRMRAGEFPDGAHVLRARIDMAHANMLLRDPVLYRIRHAHHYRTGDAWCIYPTYDFAHGYCDSLEGITHSLCTLEFEVHRPLYDWLLEELDLYRPQQIEFARLNLTYTVMSKRKLLQLVQGGLVRGWDDPRMPTLSGMRRRGYTPAGIRKFCDTVGVARFNGTNEIELLQHCIREDLNRTSPRVMAVLDPVKVVIENYPEGKTEELLAQNNPEDPAAGQRRVPFGRELWIEREDFMAEPAPKFFRLAPGREVRLRWAYFVTCTGVRTDVAGNVVELRCKYDPATRGGDAPDGRKVKATLHWVSVPHALSCEARLYDHLFRSPDPEAGADFVADLNPDSLRVAHDVKVEPSVAGAAAGARFQFERLGYFCVDPDSAPGALVFNRTVGLKDAWAKIQQRSE